MPTTKNMGLSILDITENPNLTTKEWKETMDSNFEKVDEVFGELVNTLQEANDTFSESIDLEEGDV